MKRIRLLYVGQFPPPIGGATLWSEKFCLAMQKIPKVDLAALNTSRRRFKDSQKSELLEDLLLWFKTGLSFLYLNIMSRFDAVMFGVTPRGYLFQAIPFSIVARALGGKIAVKFFGGDLDLFYASQGSLFQNLIRYYLKRMDLVTIETQKVEDFLRILGLSAERFFVMPNFYQGDLSRANEDGIKGAGETRFVYVSHVREEKGIFYLLDAVRTLIGEGITGFSLHVWGPVFPKTREKFEKSIREIFPHAIYKGVFAHRDVRKFLNQYDVFVFPSYLPEGHPGVIIEAMSCGLPVIAANCRSIPELIKDGENGILVEPRDSRAILQAMKSFIDDTGLIVTMGSRNAKLAHRFSEEVVVKEFFDRMNALFQ